MADKDAKTLTGKANRLAIIVPNFNYERYIGRAIESVTSQGRDDVDLFVVDDGSTDQSWELIQGYGLTNTYRVPNGGPRKACLAAARNTDANFILVLDADDELKPGSLNRLMPLLAPDVAKVQFTLTPIDAEGNELGSPAPQLQDFREHQSLIDEICATGCYTSPPTSGNVFRRDVFDLLEDADYDKFVDGVTIFAAPFFGYVVSLSDRLGCYRMHGANASGVGGSLDLHKIRSDIERFEARLDHLRHILVDRGLGCGIPKAQDTFFHRERSLYLTIAEGRRPTASQVFGALSSLRHQPMSIKRKGALAAFALISLAFRPSIVALILEYRLTPSKRSAYGLIRKLVVGSLVLKATRVSGSG